MKPVLSEMKRAAAMAALGNPGDCHKKLPRTTHSRRNNRSDQSLRRVPEIIEKMRSLGLYREAAEAAWALRSADIQQLSRLAVEQIDRLEQAIQSSLYDDQYLLNTCNNLRRVYAARPQMTNGD